MSWRRLHWCFYAYEPLSSSASGCRVQTSDQAVPTPPSRLCNAAGSQELRTGSCEIKVVLLKATPIVHSNKAPPTLWLQLVGAPRASQGLRLGRQGDVSSAVANQR